jgi:membrane associated rhomboid family serine protease
VFLAGGFVATMTQTLVTLAAGSGADAQVPQLGASGAIAAVLGAYYVLYPQSRVLTLVFVFLVRIPAWVFLGVWFLFQLIEGNFGLLTASANGGGTAFFAHVGGFLFGLFIARVVAGAVARRPAAAPSTPKLQTDWS